jgi:glucan biosynthesis protein C
MTAVESTTAVAPPGARVWFIDNLRIGLIVLVVLHHVALAYGAAPFYYTEVDPSGFPRGLLVFALFNQSWFMGAFFLIAGYFTPGSVDRKGSGAFLKDRLLRLGIPLVVYAFVLNPVSFFGAFFLPDFLGPLTWETYNYIDYVRMGPMWFVAMLLIFSFGYATWRALTDDRSSSSGRRSSPPGYFTVAAFLAALAGTSYLLRMQIPIGKTVLDFPTLSYLPQYLSFFVLGTVAYRRDWFRRLPASMGAAGFVAAAAAAVFLFPLAFSGRMFSLELSEVLDKALGNGHWQSAVYTIWDSIFAIGMCLGLIVLLRTFLDGQGRFGRFLARHSYTVYIVHIPVVVFLAIALRRIEMEHLLKFAMASVIAVPLCFVVAYLVRRIPLASKIL